MHYHYGINPHKTILVMVLGNLVPLVVYMDPLGIMLQGVLLKLITGYGAL